MNYSLLFDTLRNFYTSLSYNDKYGRAKIPFRYFLELTYRCNLACPYCYVGSERNKQELTLEEWKKVISQIPFYSIVTLVGGEPLIRKDFIQILEAVSKKVLGKTHVVSNGILINDEIIDAFIKYHLLLLSISLDGYGENHDKNRRKEGIFDRIISNLENLKSKKPKQMIDIKTIVLENNLDDLPKLYKMCTKMNFDFLSISFLRNNNWKQNSHLEESFIRYTGWPVLLVTSFFTALVITMVTIGIKKIIIGIPLDIGVLILFLFVSVGLLIFGIRIPVVLPFVTGVIAFVMAMIINYVTEGKQKKYLKTAFKQYLSPAVIEKLVADPSQLKLGGERKEITIFFSDVQGFTSISEKLDPVRLTELLNEYLSFMSGIIMNSGGTIDKYEGDAIIAFWNAPTSQPDHSLRGLTAAMECQLKLQERLPYFEEKYGVRLLTRIGMNTGFAVVGNMGSRERFDYTMVGDSVNLASRLEGLNKQFGTYFMCTEKTFTSANCILVNEGKSPVPGRKLATVAVVGKKDSAVVYEPMTQERFEREKKTLEIFDKGRDLFYAGDFINAMKVFETIKEKDIPSFFYWEKCRDFLNNPPENWKGVWVASSK